MFTEFTGTFPKIIMMAIIMMIIIIIADSAKIMKMFRIVLFY